MKTILDLHNEEQAEAARHDMARRELWVGLDEEGRLKSIREIDRCILMWFVVGLVAGFSAAMMFWLVSRL